jgi:cell division FtsZ-interacting protein ZapD
MRTLDDVFDSWDTLTAMAADLDVPRARVEKWRERKSIPVDAWTPVLTALKRKGKELTSDRLLSMHERARRSA